MANTERHLPVLRAAQGENLAPSSFALMDELLPRFGWTLADPLAGMGERRWLEIGFGGGEHLAHQAALHPDVSFIGAEPFVNGVAKLLALIEEVGFPT
jgi:tRNA (guanine-N7-)-methyltransferase